MIQNPQNPSTQKELNEYITECHKDIHQINEKHYPSRKHTQKRQNHAK